MEILVYNTTVGEAKRNVIVKGIGYLQVLFLLLLNLEAWNLACVCNIEIP